MQLNGQVVGLETLYRRYVAFCERVGALPALTFTRWLYVTASRY